MDPSDPAFDRGQDDDAVEEWLKAPLDPADPTFLHEVALRSLVVHLRSQGLSPHPVEGGIALGQVGDWNLICRCIILSLPEAAHASITPVGIEVQAFPATESQDAALRYRLRDIAVGLSEDRAAAVVQATHIWSEGVLPPIRHAFEPNPDKDDPRVRPFEMAVRDSDTGNLTDWKLFLGNAQVGGPDSGPFAEFVSEGKLARLLLNALTVLGSIPDLYGIKVYVARQVTGELIVECKVNDVDWPEAASILRNATWPQVSGFVQYRQYLTMRPTETVNPQVRRELEKFARASPPTPSPRGSRWWPFKKNHPTN